MVFNLVADDCLLLVEVAWVYGVPGSPAAVAVDTIVEAVLLDDFVAASEVAVALADSVLATGVAVALVVVDTVVLDPVVLLAAAVVRVLPRPFSWSFLLPLLRSRLLTEQVS